MSVPRTQPDMFADLYTRLERLESKAESRSRKGKITDVDYEKGLARVAMGKDQVTGEPMKSPWLPWEEQAMGVLKHHTPPSVGEQAEVHSENGDWTDATIKTSLPSDQNQRPSKNGGEYVRTVGNVRVTEKDGQVTINVGGVIIEIAGGKINLVGDIHHTGSMISSGDHTAPAFHGVADSALVDGDG